MTALSPTTFAAVLPEDIEWKPFPAFPPPARLAVLVGDPAHPGPYVISGIFYIGLGTAHDPRQQSIYEGTLT
jgi:hypothetical protein